MEERRDLIACMDSGDHAAPGRFELQLDVLARLPEVGIVSPESVSGHRIGAGRPGCRRPVSRAESRPWVDPRSFGRASALVALPPAIIQILRALRAR